MKINICAIKKNRGASIDFSFLLSVQDILPEEQSFVDEISVNGIVTNVGTGLLVKGVIESTVVDICARCLADLTKEQSVDFSEEYFSQGEEEDFYKYDGDFLDIRELVRELLLMEKPVKSLCREDCKGLCTVCGQNLNEILCSCDRETIDPRLANLKNYIN